MTTPTGTIAASHVNVEVGNSATAEFSLGGAQSRNLADVLSGSIGYSDLRGRTHFTVSISPSFSSTSSDSVKFDTSSHTASPSVGVATSYSWGILDEPLGVEGTVVSGATSATATLKVETVANPFDGTVTFYCDVTVNGNTERRTMTKRHRYTGTNN